MSFISELIDKVKGKKRELLNEGKEIEIKDTKKQEIDQKDIKVEYFSKLEEGILKHDIRIVYNEKAVSVGSLTTQKGPNSAEHKKEPPIREVVSQIEKDLKTMNTSKSMYELENIKERTKHDLQGICECYPNFIVDKEIISFIEDFTPEQVIDYEQLESLPKKIDTDKLTDSQKKRISIKMKNRLEELEQINTPEDAWEDKEKILSFIKSIENTPFNPLINANIESHRQGKELDEDTSKLVAKQIKDIENEDGALYSVYLKIEEKRIWEQIKHNISRTIKTTNTDKADINVLKRVINELNKYELHDVQQGFSSEILKYIIDQIREENTEKYIEYIKQKDLMLATILIKKFPNVENKNEILQFLSNRIQCLGQLSNTECNPLRTFIETTDFKTENNTESKQFLLLASQIEKTYIEDQFRELLEFSMQRNRTNVNLFKERVSSNTVTTNNKINTDQNKENLEKDEEQIK